MMRWLLLLAVVTAAADSTKVYQSPDRQLKAVVKANAAGEALVEFRSAGGRLLQTRDERSSDGQHGQEILRAGWTPDSQWFVASTVSSGGHQPWARPLWAYSRARNEVFDLDRSGIVAVDTFRVSAPDRVRTTVVCPPSEEHKPLTFQLSGLLDGTLPNPCPSGKN
jgi:hypothetical protein